MHENTARKIATNTIGQIVLRSIDVVLGVITLALITRYLGQEGFGHYTTVTAFLQLFIIVIDLGLYLTLLREISAESEDRISFITSNIFTLRLFTSIVFLALASLLVFFIPYPREVQFGVIALSAGFLFTSLISTLTAVYQKYLQVVRVAAVSVLIKIITLALTILIIQYHAGLQALLIGNSLALGIGFIAIWLLLFRLPRPLTLTIQFNIPYLTHVMRIAWPIALTTALNLIYFKADTIMLSLLRSAEEVGLYGASYRVVEIITTFPHMFMGLIMPLLTAAWVAKQYDRLQFVWEKTVIFFAFLTLPMVTGTFVVGERMMKLVAGEDFAISGSILKLLIIATAAIFFGTLYTYMVLVIEKQRAMIKYFLATAVIALLGYAILIPRYSYWGAAAMTIVSEALIVVCAAFVVTRERQLPLPWLTIAKLGAASVLMACITFYLQPFIALIPLIFTSVLIYIAFVVLFRAITLDDVRLLKR